MEFCGFVFRVTKKKGNVKVEFGFGSLGATDVLESCFRCLTSCLQQRSAAPPQAEAGIESFLSAAVCRLSLYSLITRLAVRHSQSIAKRPLSAGINTFVCLWVVGFFFWKVEEGGKKGKKEGKERKSGSSSARCGCQVTVGFHLSTPPPSFPRVSECGSFTGFHL